MKEGTDRSRDRGEKKEFERTLGEGGGEGYWGRSGLKWVSYNADEKVGGFPRRALKEGDENCQT